ncbi:MAG: hypothetical protein ACRBCJ_06760 [Hyphomicrobiaceae bacterium]
MQLNLTPALAKCHTACSQEHGPIAYTIGTLVNNREMYDALVASFVANGFTENDCEYLFIDNTGDNQTCAYRGLDAVLNSARGRHVILCHQDVILLDDNRAVLDAQLDNLTKNDPNWALAGNAGGVTPGQLALRITDPHGDDQHVCELPTRVMSLDENFIIVRSESRLGFSHDLSGFHFYGADICLHADVMGRTAYVIDFHLKHLSGGFKDQMFEDMKFLFQKKWSRAMAPRWLQTTCSLMRLTGDPVGQLASQITTRPYAKFKRMMTHDGGWSGKSEQTAELKKAQQANANR